MHELAQHITERQEREARKKVFLVEQRSHGVALKAIHGEIAMLTQMERAAHTDSLIAILQRAASDVEELRATAQVTEKQEEGALARFEQDAAQAKQTLDAALDDEKAHLADIQNVKLQTMKDEADTKQEADTSEQYLATLRPTCDEAQGSNQVDTSEQYLATLRPTCDEAQ